jgi:hypothetical protein
MLIENESNEYVHLYTCWRASISVPSNKYSSLFKPSSFFLEARDKKSSQLREGSKMCHLNEKSLGFFTTDFSYT